MGALTDELRRFLDGQPVGVLATRSAEGNPRQSLVYFAREGDRLVISTLANRLKAQDVRRSGWASLCVMAHEPPYPSATFSGPAEILTENIGPPTARVMQRITRAPAAEPPEAMSDEALHEAGRVILVITVERVTAANYIEAATSGY
jgi:PPOX class probable F420-dependent enzyme